MAAVETTIPKAIIREVNEKLHLSEARKEHPTLDLMLRQGERAVNLFHDSRTALRPKDAPEGSVTDTPGKPVNCDTTEISTAIGTIVLSRVVEPDRIRCTVALKQGTAPPAEIGLAEVLVIPISEIPYPLRDELTGSGFNEGDEIAHLSLFYPYQKLWRDGGASAKIEGGRNGHSCSDRA